MSPLLFWGVHVGIDEFQSATLSHSAVIESVVFTAVCSGIFLVQYRRWVALTPESNVAGYLSHLWERANVALRLH
ncbi:MAG: hypothetical protein JW880_03825 [Candidatus Thermoplasmatota archaeon]|nr:hypothetical protein [Candidatus Thermoplasmatota archaeon]